MAPQRTIPLFAIATALTVLTAPLAEAGRIEQACKQSDRASGRGSVCTCIQQVADQMLSRRDQKLAASFFQDPHKAQEIRQSDNRRDEKFWKRYKQFGSTAARSCS